MALFLHVYIRDKRIYFFHTWGLNTTSPMAGSHSRPMFRMNWAALLVRVLLNPWLKFALHFFVQEVAPELPLDYTIYVIEKPHAQVANLDKVRSPDLGFS